MPEFTVHDYVLPVIPEDIPEDLKEYLRELELVVRSALKGSSYINKVFEDGIFGN